MNQDVFFTDNTTIHDGYNTFLIKKAYHYGSPVFYLVINNKKTLIEHELIEDTICSMGFSIKKGTKKAHIKIIDGLSEGIINLKYSHGLKKSTSDFFDIKTDYISDKIHIYLKRTVASLDVPINIEGDFNKNVIWKSGSKKLDISFPHLIKGNKTFVFKINGTNQTIKIYNREDFPKNIIKVNNGIKLNKSCSYDLRVLTKNKEYSIKKGESFLYEDFSDLEEISVFIEDFFLFKQTVRKNNYYPFLTILEKPLRVKISQPYYEEIKFKFKNDACVYIIPQGQTEATLTTEKGIRILEFEFVKNASYEKKHTIIHIS